MPAETEPAQRVIRHAPDPERLGRVAVAPITDLRVADPTATGDGSWTLEGYAAVFEAETTLYDTRFLRMREVISRGAFTDVLGRDPLVHLNFSHQMDSAVAATDVTGIGGLELSEDFHGLRFFARVDPADPDAIRLAAKMRRGVVRQASFAFTIDDETLEGDSVDSDGVLNQLWRINNIRDLFDVCACAQGAYPQTESHIRSLTATYLGRADTAGPPDRAQAGPELIAPSVGRQTSSDLESQRRARERIRALALYPRSAK